MISRNFTARIRSSIPLSTQISPLVTSSPRDSYESVRQRAMHESWRLKRFEIDTRGHTKHIWCCSLGRDYELSSPRTRKKRFARSYVREIKLHCVAPKRSFEHGCCAPQPNHIDISKLKTTLEHNHAQVYISNNSSSCLSHS